MLAFYVVVELVAAAALTWALGLGWALVVLAATFMLGVLLSAGQIKGQVDNHVAILRSGRRSPQGALADGVLIGLGSFLVFLPGLVSTAAGVLMLTPPTRAAMRPLAQSMLTSGIGGRIAAVTTSTTRRTDYIDGEVIEDAVALTR